MENPEHIQAFLDSGGEIQKLPPEATGVNAVDDKYNWAFQMPLSKQASRNRRSSGFVPSEGAWYKQFD